MVHYDRTRMDKFNYARTNTWETLRKVVDNCLTIFPMLTVTCGPNRFQIIINSTLLQVLGQKLTVPSRNLQPPSPARLQAGFVIPPKDSRTTVSQSPTPSENGSPRSKIVPSQTASPQPREHRTILYLLIMIT
ncbi:uncharacterized protein MELLADRAFT_84871 [Melampsora larici-populina 98AG31]|uniref:Uncharacterized protein n=1 Tax=Melampsora larici-populina (strain 98AG31 / pathotype 3-4-7) TaxID=747676 RepID=F4RGX1_MELLP|nr:uncharacterized protein MELLADRAFT_84871 [Melampsora larici-populina 98AG31]EGG08126.1 hypothetical protein MELLADRAFT_84871 [Melampsora larici-populina 98AG31]